MTLAIRDNAPNSIMLVHFDAIATCLEPEAEKYFWCIPIIDGMLRAGDASYTLDDAYAEASASLHSPISWQELRRWSTRFFQIYDCEFQTVGATVCDALKICCIDSAEWEITTEIGDIIERIRRAFKITVDV
jgi:hypothetical protein